MCNDEIKVFLVRELQVKPSVVVAVEQTIIVTDQGLTGGVYVLRPDIILMNGAGVYVVDVTVRLESINSLHQVAQEKIEKDHNAESAQAFNYEGVQREMISIVVNSSGFTLKFIINHHKKLGIYSHVKISQDNFLNCFEIVSR